MVLNNTFQPLIGISIICFLVGQALKILPLQRKYLPILVAVVGAALGALGHTITGFIIADGVIQGSIIDAICTGAVSGFASSGLYDSFSLFFKGEIPTDGKDISLG